MIMIFLIKNGTYQCPYDVLNTNHFFDLYLLTPKFDLVLSYQFKDRQGSSKILVSPLQMHES